MFDHISNETLHHAYVVIGNRQDILPRFYEMLTSTLNTQIDGNPNVWNKVYANFTIDDARELQELHSRKAVGEGKRFFIIAVDSLTLQAQNALLKMFEEPGINTHFFLVTPSLSRILQTLQSRVVVLQENNTTKSQSPNELLDKGNTFISASKAERLKIVKELLADIEKEKSVKQDAIMFLQIIMTILHSKKSSTWTKNDAYKLQELAKANNYIQDQSSSIKLILEYVALII